MKLHRLRLLSAGIAVLAAGCAGTPSREDYAAAQRLPMPASQQAAEHAVLAYFDATLADPESAQISFSPVVRGAYVALGRARPGVYLCGTINARNRFGGYVGRDVFLARFDPVTGSTVERVEFDERTGVFTRLCQQVYAGPA